MAHIILSSHTICFNYSGTCAVIDTLFEPLIIKSSKFLSTKLSDSRTRKTNMYVTTLRSLSKTDIWIFLKSSYVKVLIKRSIRSSTENALFKRLKPSSSSLSGTLFYSSLIAFVNSSDFSNTFLNHFSEN